MEKQLEPLEKEFTHMITQYLGILYKIANIYCKEAEDRKDLLQEMILQLWKAFPDFRKESSVSTWIYRISLNTAISNFRKSKRHFFHYSLSTLPFEFPDTETFVYDDESIVALHKAITCLSTIEKAVIVLYLEEKSYQEMSEILGITKSNVGVKLNRIKSKLEALLKTDSYALR